MIKTKGPYRSISEWYRTIKKEVSIICNIPFLTLFSIKKPNFHMTIQSGARSDNWYKRTTAQWSNCWIKKIPVPFIIYKEGAQLTGAARKSHWKERCWKECKYLSLKFRNKNMITGGQTTVATRIVYLGTVRVFSAHIYVFRCRHTIWAIKQNLIKKGKSTSMLYFLNKRSHLLWSYFGIWWSIWHVFNKF